MTNFFFAVDGNNSVGFQFRRLFFSLCPNTCEYTRSELPSHMHRRPSYASQCPSDEHSLTRFGLYGSLDQLSARCGDQGKRRCLLEAQCIRDRSEHVGFGNRVFRVGAIRQCHDTHSLRETLNVAARFRNFTGKVSA
jgi:hypothetical protein